MDQNSHRSPTRTSAEAVLLSVVDHALDGLRRLHWFDDKQRSFLHRYVHQPQIYEAVLSKSLDEYNCGNDVVTSNYQVSKFNWSIRSEMKEKELVQEPQIYQFVNSFTQAKTQNKIKERSTGHTGFNCPWKPNVPVFEPCPSFTIPSSPGTIRGILLSAQISENEAALGKDIIMHSEQALLGSASAGPFCESPLFANIPFVTAGMGEDVVSSWDNDYAEVKEAEKTNCWSKKINGSRVFNFDGEVVGFDAPRLNTDNRGAKMMSKMGWMEGESLGSSNQGILTPIVSTIKTTRAGLGASTTTRTSASGLLWSTPEETVVQDLDIKPEWDKAPEIDEATLKKFQRARKDKTPDLRATKTISANPKGIRVRYIHEGDFNQAPFKLTARLGLDDYCRSQHYPGLVVQAIDSQDAKQNGNRKYLKITNNEGLMITGRLSGRSYEAISQDSRDVGLVRIVSMDMVKAPTTTSDIVIDDGFAVVASNLGVSATDGAVGKLASEIEKLHVYSNNEHGGTIIT